MSAPPPPLNLRLARCRAHPEREAAALCRGCGLTWCRECVTESGGGLYCRRCLPAAAAAAPFRIGPGRILAAALGAIAALLLFALFAALPLYLVASTPVVHLFTH